MVLESGVVGRVALAVVQVGIILRPGAVVAHGFTCFRRWHGVVVLVGKALGAETQVTRPRQADCSSPGQASGCSSPTSTPGAPSRMEATVASGQGVPRCGMVLQAKDPALTRTVCSRGLTKPDIPRNFYEFPDCWSISLVRARRDRTITARASAPYAAIFASCSKTRA